MSETLPASQALKKKQIDPALLTFAEYYRIANSTDKFHDNTAYDWPVERMNENDWNAISHYPKLLRNLRIRGISFQIREQRRKNTYHKRTPEGSLLMVNGESQTYSDEEVALLGYTTHEVLVAIFEMENKQCVAVLEDEWGCVLVAVAQEYRGFGLGPILVEMQRRAEPGKTSGGFTPGGYRNFQKVYAHFVREALASGLYRRLLQSGDITLDRIKEITSSIRTDREKPKTGNMASSDPKDWLLYVGEYGDFIIYDRKVKDLIEDGWDKNAYWIERMILGLAYVSGERHLRLMQFGATTPMLRTFLMTCALSFCANKGESLNIEGNEHKYVRPEYGSVGPESYVVGFKSQEVTPTGKTLDYGPMGMAERKFRAGFDRFGEFGNHLQELAYGKFKGLSESILADLVAWSRV